MFASKVFLVSALAWTLSLSVEGSPHRSTSMKESHEEKQDLYHTPDFRIDCKSKKDQPCSRGAVQIYNKERGVWGNICATKWNILSARIVCEQLQFSGVKRSMKLRRRELSHKSRIAPTLWYDVSCRGDEKSINECVKSVASDDNCPRNLFAAVQCTGSPSATSKSAFSSSMPAKSPTYRQYATDYSKMTHKSYSSSCGIAPHKNRRSLTKIVGGYNSQSHEYPWQVAKYVGGVLDCAGTLIAPCWVLTAAHCFRLSGDKENSRIRVGDHKAQQREGTEQDFRVEKVILHPDYDPYRSGTGSSKDNDIALIKIRNHSGQCAQLNPYVQPACLPSSKTQFKEGHMCHIIGWGYQHNNGHGSTSAVLKDAEVPLIGRQKCLRDTNFDSYYYGDSWLTKNMFCAGVPEGGIDTCQGDSGGPLLCQDNSDQFVVWGITSWGNGCAHPGFPGLYTVVANYLDWIEKTMKR